MDTVLYWFQIVLTVFGAASVIVAALKPIAALTETKKDDELLYKIGKGLDVVIKVLDKLAVNTTPKK
ncbi:hypothetical protein HYP07_gp074 [Vibrio phage JSF3]|uniref:TMhelix containing protein n=1 Tax=Vibrio phage phi 1 TaxID=1589297 RepID=A0A0B5H2L2_9CAUD|nr:hypothetical protein AVV30_gp039 [Vibrio phage phi 1]YP_009876299.1 hypothetical protein HYP07_gp074 [Vibrio phage JSF3]AJF40697.1 hypothetical protein SBVP1_0039 [Vibrio phage phi 1]APD18086.1 hypothetical protein [Vibrio phage JSF3]